MWRLALYLSRHLPRPGPHCGSRSHVNVCSCVHTGSSDNCLADTTNYGHSHSNAKTKSHCVSYTHAVTDGQSHPQADTDCYTNAFPSPNADVRTHCHTRPRARLTRRLTGASVASVRVEAVVSCQAVGASATPDCYLLLD
ncbi:MAG: hypothetical protein HY680_09595 [Chloroflexi bacterium]|nr:hypothetical protein [Chloroflexota bacterium]